MRLSPGLDFGMARVAVGNERCDQLRLPGAPMGLVGMGVVRPSKEGDLLSLFGWQAAMGYRRWEEDDEMEDE